MTPIETLVDALTEAETFIMAAVPMYARDRSEAPNVLARIRSSLADARALLAQIPSPPPECQSEAEKTAFAFGWWKAQETAASRATECEQKQPNTDSIHLAEGGNSAACGDKADEPRARASWKAASDALIAYRKKNGPKVSPQWGADAAKLLECAAELLETSAPPVSTGWDMQHSFRVGG